MPHALAHPPDRPLAAVLDGMRLVFARVLAAIAEDDDIDPRLVQSATSAANTIVRIVQAETRLTNPNAALDAAIEQVLDELDAEARRASDAADDPRAAGEPDLAAGADLDAASDDPARDDPVLDDQEVMRDQPDCHPPLRPCPPRPASRTTSPAPRPRPRVRLRGRHPPDGR